MGDITKINVWRKSLGLAEVTYKITQTGSLSKDFSFRDQIRRSAVSIPSNIAEGLNSGFDRLGVRYFYTAKGSAAELKTQLILAIKIGYLKNEEISGILDDIETVDKMLNRLITYRKNLYRKEN